MIMRQMTDVMRAAAGLMLSFAKPEVYQKEGHANFVTAGDVAVQAYLIEHLQALMPEAVFLAEEKENAVLTDAPTFIIDPIDGTTNYMRHRRRSCISVALTENRQTTMAAVYDPYHDEMFRAERGKGAYVNDQPIHASDTPFQNALVSIGTSPYMPELAERTMRASQQFLLEAGDLRRLGSAALDLCDIASGVCDVYWELVLSPWDFAAGSLIVTEAGGCCVNPFEGELRQGEKQAVLASNPACLARSEALIRKFGV